MASTRAAEVMDIRLHRGLDLRIAEPPEQAVRGTLDVTRIGWQSEDLPGIRPRFLVEEGARVRIGDPLLVDKLQPEVIVSAPAAGRVSRLETGPRRLFQRLEIAVEADDWREFDSADPALDGPALRALMLQSGLWTTLLERPLGRIPAPASEAPSLFIQAHDTQPLAADARVVIGEAAAEFACGAQALIRLVDGPVFVCQGPGEPLLAGDAQLRVVRFHGRHPAGLAGTHIHHLFPLHSGRRTWQIHYQDVITLGHLLLTGRLPAQRVVSIAGTRARQPALYWLRPGAELDTVQRIQGLDPHAEPHAITISGSLLHGRVARYLGRRHHQVTLMQRQTPRFAGWLGWLPRAGRSAILPLERLEQVLPMGLLPTPLLRALAVGDLETAIQLGALQLLEEDLDLINHVCASGVNHGSLLRRILDDWVKQSAAQAPA